MILQALIHLGYSCSRQTILTMADEKVDAVNHALHGWQLFYYNNNNNKWNQQVQTDRTIPNNKPDIIIRDNEKRTCMLIDVAISGDRNVIKKEAEKILKYCIKTLQ